MERKNSNQVIMGDSGRTPVFKCNPDLYVTNALRTLKSSGLATKISPFEELTSDKCSVNTGVYDSLGECFKRVIISPAYDDKIVSLVPHPRAYNVSKDVRSGCLLFSVESFHYALSEKPLHF